MKTSRTSIRIKIEPRSVPALYAARYLGLTLPQFEACKEALFFEGFPKPDEITGNYDLKAIAEYLDRRSHLDLNSARDARIVSAGRINRWPDGKH